MCVCIFFTDVLVDGTPPTGFSSASALNLNGEVYLYGGSTSQPQGFLYKVCFDRIIFSLLTWFGKRLDNYTMSSQSFYFLIRFPTFS